MELAPISRQLIELTGDKPSVQSFNRQLVRLIMDAVGAQAATLWLVQENELVICEELEEEPGAVQNIRVASEEQQNALRQTFEKDSVVSLRGQEPNRWVVFVPVSGLKSNIGVMRLLLTAPSKQALEPAIRADIALVHADLADAIRELVAHNGGGDCSVYVQVTRGTAPRNHAFPETVHPTVVMTCTPLEAVPAEWLAEGVAAITMEDIRWDRCDIKAITLLPNVMARQRAEENGALEALWVHQGQVVEGAASNLFAVFDGTAVTPPDGPRILPGITRNVVLELARERSLPVETAPLSRQDLDAAEEVWLTASTKAILPVTRLDDHKVGQGRPGPLFHEVLAAYRERIQQLRERTNEGDGQEGIP